jgi:hypothetical protein
MHNGRVAFVDELPGSNGLVQIVVVQTVSNWWHVYVRSQIDGTCMCGLKLMARVCAVSNWWHVYVPWMPCVHVPWMPCVCHVCMCHGCHVCAMCACAMNAMCVPCVHCHECHVCACAMNWWHVYVQLEGLGPWAPPTNQCVKRAYNSTQLCVC